jgi:cytoskeletal protein CcmA (bactofilin family)
VWKKEEPKSQAVPEISTTPKISTAPPQPAASTPREVPPSVVPTRSGASISQGIRIKGEVRGSEDLFVDGHVEGQLSLSDGVVTVGPNGQVNADITAREVVVQGRVQGKVSGRERVQLRSTGLVQGEVTTERLGIEEGAVLRGKVEAGKRSERESEPKVLSVAAGMKNSGTTPIKSAEKAN